MTGLGPSLSRIDKGLLAVLGWAVVIRILHLYAFFSNSPFSATLVSDAHIFESWAARIAGGDWVGDPALFVLPPLYPYWVGTIYTVVGRDPHLIIILQSILGVIGAGLIWRMTTRRIGPVAGVAAGCLYASMGTVLFYESMLVGTALAVFLTILALFCLDLHRSGSSLRALAFSGLCFGLLAVLRPNFILVIPVAAAICVWPIRATPAWPRILGVFALAACVPLALLTLRNGVVAGEWTPMSSHGGINFYMGNHLDAPGWFAPPPGMPANITPHEPEGNLLGPRRVAESETGRRMTDREVSAYWLGKGLRFWVTQPAQAIGVTLRKLRLFLSAHEVPLNYSFEYHRQYALALNLPFGQMWFLLSLAALSILGARQLASKVADWFWIGAIYAVSVIAFHVSTRYRMPIVPVLAVVGGAGIQAAWEYVRLKDWRSVSYGVVGLVALVALVGYERETWAEHRALSMDPFNLGTSFLYAGQPDRALPLLEEARRAGGRFPALHYNLGLTYTALGRTDSARTAYEQALVIDPNLAPAHTNLGNIRFQAGDYRLAESSYRSALALDSAAHNARAALGWVHFTYHRNDSARVAWETVLKLDPGNRSALAGMDRLR